ncbi:hypothetical protein [Nocardioides sp. B-3]|uniref:hypothetical protein n=1 Tax=Nocardioides sp. B-3 TaxID=2895565 RepID=UPI0021527588|nr:hypothetical protein [Nocardioides sp. B-3]UUZ57810.1 hypothetical protein LP418_15530 [Nocardioides sp. B-3]
MSTREQAPPRTLADQLRRWPDARLATLLQLRPDLATPAPHDSAQLASRAATRSSVLRALDNLSRLELSVLDALVVANQTTQSELLRIVHADPVVTAVAIERLIDFALVWESPGGLRPLSGVGEALKGDESAGVSGLRPMSADPGSPADVVARLDSVSPRAARCSSTCWPTAARAPPATPGARSPRRRHDPRRGADRAPPADPA